MGSGVTLRLSTPARRSSPKWLYSLCNNFARDRSGACFRPFCCTPGCRRCSLEFPPRRGFFEQT